MFKIDKLAFIVKEIFDALFDKAEDDARSNYISYVDHFYNDYDPLYYHRLGNIVTHTNGLYDGLTIKNDDRIFEWGVYASLLPPHQQSNSIVAELNMRQGIHGGIQFIKSKTNPPITTPSIIQSMDQFWETYRTSTVYKNLAFLLKKYENKINKVLEEVS